jgi:peptidoglycan/LPS O-acetylase OafA/YrhL
LVNRYEELVSLRGVAALIVLFSHYIFVIPMKSESFIPYIKILTSGHSAVILFFVLSGFVLSLPFFQNTKVSYSKYLIRRICRIYIPYLIVTILAYLAKVALTSKIGIVPDIRGLGTWTDDTTVNSLINHLLFLGEYKWYTFNMVIWTLVHEMRVSIIFPFIMIFVLKASWRLNVLASLILSGIGYIMMLNVPSAFHVPVSTNYFVTMHYTSMFIIGANLAKHRVTLLRIIAQSKTKYLFLPMGLLFFSYPRIPFTLFSKLIGSTEYNLYLIMIDWFITIGAVLIILHALGANYFSKFLLMKPVHYLGKTSFSMYLIHALILLVMLHIFYEMIPIPVIVIMSLIITIFSSAVCYRFIEEPAIKLGKYLTNRRGNSRLTNHEEFSKKISV